MPTSLAVLRAPRALAALSAALAACFSIPAIAQTHSLLNPVVVTATRTPTAIERVVADVVAIDAEQIRDAVGSTIEDVLREYAGVQALRNGGPGQSASVLMRGASAANTVVLIDGVRVGSATLGQAELEGLSLAQIDHIEVLRGPASSLYGADAVGGVIQIFTRRGQGDRPRVHAALAAGRYDSREGSAGVSGAAGGFDYAASFGQESTAGVSAIAAPGNPAYNPDADGFRRNSASLQLGYRPVEDHRIGLRWTESRLNAQYDGAEYLPPTFAADASPDFRNKLDTHVLALDYAARLSSAWRSEITLARSDDKLTSGGTVLSHFNTERQQALWQHTWNFAKGQALVGLLEHTSESVRATPFGAAARKRDNNAVVLSYTGEAGPHRWQADLRRDGNSAYGDQTTGKLGYGYHISAPWSVRASAGTAFRAPTFNDLYYPGYGVPSVRPEEARSFELGTAWREAGWSAQATVYRSHVRDMIGYEPNRSFCPPGSAYDFGCARNISRARLQGASLAAQGVQGAWHWALGAEFLDAKDDATGQRLPRRAAHTATASLAYRTETWSAKAALQNVGSRPDVGFTAFSSVAATLPSYTLLDLSAYYAVARQWRLEAKLLNALDKRYEPVKDYGAPGRTLWVGLRYDSLGF